MAVLVETQTRLEEAREAVDEYLRVGERPCLTCSFQAEDMVALDLLREKAPDIPVLFLETGYQIGRAHV